MEKDYIKICCECENKFNLSECGIETEIENKYYCQFCMHLAEITTCDVEIIATADELGRIGILPFNKLSGAKMKAWDIGTTYCPLGAAAKVFDEYSEIVYFIIPTEYFKIINI